MLEGGLRQTSDLTGMEQIKKISEIHVEESDASGMQNITNVSISLVVKLQLQTRPHLIEMPFSGAVMNVLTCAERSL